ncbi:MAG: alanyl-tRNA editing protein [Clostridia bacterium]
MEPRTELIYLENRDRLEFCAKVSDVRQCADGFAVILDRTAFFPAGGGQPGDRGELEATPVCDTTLEDGEVLHHTPRRPPFRRGDVVRGHVDASRRLDHSRQHTAQHLISAVFARDLGADTLSFHLGKRECTVDFDISPEAVDRKKLDQLEARVNEYVMQNLPVTVVYPDGGEDGPEQYRRAAGEIRGALRLVRIGDDLDVSACCGTHTRHTGEIGPVFLEEYSRVRGGLRLTLSAGDRSLKVNRDRRSLLLQLATRLETPAVDLPKRLENVLSELDDLNEGLKRAASSLAELRARDLARPSRDALLLLETWDESEVPDENHPRAVAAHLPQERDWVFLAGLVSGNAVRVTMVRSPRSEVDLTARPLELFREFGGRGGGSADLVRGAIDLEGYAAFSDALREHLDSTGDKSGG